MKQRLEILREIEGSHRIFAACGMPVKLDGNTENIATGNDGEGVLSPDTSEFAPLLRKEFDVPEKIKRARVYISGLGWHELFINGARVGDHVLDPATSNYHKRAYYVTYDVTEMLAQGRNAVGVMLGNGWFSEPGTWVYGRNPRLRMQIMIELADGSRTVVNSDRTFKASTGPITRNMMRWGETYDARQEKIGWTKAGYDDSKWDGVVLKQRPKGKMAAQCLPPIKVNRILKPQQMTEPRPGVYVYDFGQLFSGWARLKLRGPKDTDIAIKYSARILANSGLLDERRYGGVMDRCILKGHPAGEVFEPRFAIHPVRYVQLEGCPSKPGLDDIEGMVAYTAEDMSGDFLCSNPLLNKVHTNVIWTLSNELYGLPKDKFIHEPVGYTDPATVAGTLYPRKYMPRFWTKWLTDIKDEQHEDGGIPIIAPEYIVYTSVPDPAWGGNYPLLVWYVHQYYEDTRILSEHYDSIKQWIHYLDAVAKNHIVSTGLFGDHMVPGTEPGREIFIDSDGTPSPLLWTGYYYCGARIVAQAAEILGKKDEAVHYAGLAEKIKNAINATWFNKHNNNYATGSQTCNLFALALGIVPKANENDVMNNVVRNIVDQYRGHLHTGNIGTTCMIDTLTEYGYGDLMYGVATKTTYPGWGYMIEKGATTIWERWNLGETSVESMIMWAIIEEFFYNDLAGIQGPEYHGASGRFAGFGHIHIKPFVLGDLTWVSGHIKTVRGMVSSSWRTTEDSVTLEVTVPVNSQASISVPKTGLRHVAVTESGQSVWKNGSYLKGIPGITSGSETTDHVTFETGSGSYAFVLKGQKAPHP